MNAATLKPTGSYRISKEVKRMLASMNDDTEFKTWYKKKIIQADLEYEARLKNKSKEIKEQIPE